MSEREDEVRLESQKGAGFTVFVPELPDVVTEGQTREEAFATAKDAIEGYLAHRACPGWSGAEAEARGVGFAATLAVAAGVVAVFLVGAWTPLLIRMFSELARELVRYLSRRRLCATS